MACRSRKFSRLDEQAVLQRSFRTGLAVARGRAGVPQEAYLDHLAKLIEAIGRAGESILVEARGRLHAAA